MPSEELFLKRGAVWEWTIEISDNEQLMKVTAVEELIVIWKPKSQVINDPDDKLRLPHSGNHFRCIFKE